MPLFAHILPIVSSLLAEVPEPFPMAILMVLFIVALLIAFTLPSKEQEEELEAEVQEFYRPKLVKV